MMKKTVFETRSWIARRRQAKQMATIKFDNPAFRLNINTIWTDSSHIQCGQLWPDWIIFILWSYLPSSQTNSRRPEGSLAAKESRISTIDMTNQQVRKKTDQQVMKEISSWWNKSVSANGKLPNNSAKIEQQHHQTDKKELACCRWVIQDWKTHFTTWLANNPNGTNNPYQCDQNKCDSFKSHKFLAL